MLRCVAAPEYGMPAFSARGTWSLVNGSLFTLVTRGPRGGTEASTIAPAFIAGGGLLNASHAVGRRGGLSLLAALPHVLRATGEAPVWAPGGTANISFLNVCP